MRLFIMCVAAVSVFAVENPVAGAWKLQQDNLMCPVTSPNGVVAGASERDASSYGNDKLSVWLWRDGTVIFRPGGPGFVTSDGALGMKFGWIRGVDGKLKATGHRLDGEAAPPLRLHAPDGYGTTGFQSSYLIFPTPGCWEVNAQVGDREDSRITFITNLVKIGQGPSWRLDP